MRYWFILESGRYYETSHRTSWDSGCIRAFRTVNQDGDVAEVTREEVEQWASGCSGSTS